MSRLRTSIAIKLVLGYGLLGTASIALVSGVFYRGTVGVLERENDSRLIAQSDRVMARATGRPHKVLLAEVRRQLDDGIDSDREIFELVAADGHGEVGNLTSWPALSPEREDDNQQIVTSVVIRAGLPTRARLVMRPLKQGGMLIVGRDLAEQEAVRTVIWHAVLAGAAVSLLLTVGGALLFRSMTERRLGAIRRTAAQIEAGDLSSRIPVAGDDEFALLGSDINRMLDRIERLMDGIRHVSNAIAHDLRTPLGRIRSKLDEALRHEPSVPRLTGAAHDAIEHIDDLIRLFERLLQIAEAESGVRTRLFERLALAQIARDMGEMYEASAEDRGVTLTLELDDNVQVDGDRNLLASAVASLLDNAIKYAGAGAEVRLGVQLYQGRAAIVVADTGPGIPAAELGKVTQRFYRVDASRHLPGNGLGLAIVSATALSHGGELQLEDGAPGLVARILLPLATVALAAR
ncbi:ATP-binding protein [Pseudoduganella danionis]|uniref:histidine kinase n=1 Tax=Pseudoduganella danionis TaxID=1890295 RepID=A0ABW9SH72_9BURK|nr:HAMP domain-containing sensor histidine kinase [Pseudoduganella danionis]MTW31397.1 HAMP domain-containing protein [Pseudoduganella danionis]